MQGLFCPGKKTLLITFKIVSNVLGETKEVYQMEIDPPEDF